MAMLSLVWDGMGKSGDFYSPKCRTLTRLLLPLKKGGGKSGGGGGVRRQHALWLPLFF